MARVNIFEYCRSISTEDFKKITEQDAIEYVKNRAKQTIKLDELRWQYTEERLSKISAKKLADVDKPVIVWYGSGGTLYTLVGYATAKQAIDAGKTQLSGYILTTQDIRKLDLA